jgi:transposase
MASMGRISKLSPEVRKRLCDAVAAGNNRTVAAEFAGVGRSTFLSWMAKGRCQKSGPYRDLLDAIKKAEADAEVRNVAIIQKAANKTWQAAAWWLERTHPDRWASDRHIIRDVIRQMAQQEKQIEELKEALNRAADSQVKP